MEHRDRAVELLTGIIGHREQCEEIVDNIIAATQYLAPGALSAVPEPVAKQD